MENLSIRRSIRKNTVDLSLTPQLKVLKEESEKKRAEKVFRCPFCLDTEFAVSRELIRHLRFHVEEILIAEEEASPENVTEDHVQLQATPNVEALEESNASKCWKLQEKGAYISAKSEKFTTSCPKTTTSLVSASYNEETEELEGEFKCPHCTERVFNEANALIEHLSWHKETGIFSIEDLSKSIHKEGWNCAEPITRKISEEIDEEEISSPEVEIPSPSKEENHKLEKSHKCTECPYAAHHLSGLQRHIAVHKDASRPFKCHKCKAYFRAKSGLLEHLKIHNAFETIQIKTAGMLDTQSVYEGNVENPATSMEIREQTDELEKDKIGVDGLQCPFCPGADFVHAKDLIKHFCGHRQDHSKVQNVASCGTLQENVAHSLCKIIVICCDKKHDQSESKSPATVSIAGTIVESRAEDLIPEKETSRTSVTNVNTKSSFACPKCEKTFSRKEHVTRHLKTHKTPNIRRNWRKIHKCSKCPSKFPTPYELKRHLLSHQRNPERCSKCPIVFKKKDQLLRHMEKRHPN